MSHGFRSPAGTPTSPRPHRSSPPPPAKLGAVRSLLAVMVEDDEDQEELTEEDRRALRASDDYFRNGGQGIPIEQVVADLGLTMDQIRARSKE